MDIIDYLAALKGDAKTVEPFRWSHTRMLATSANWICWWRPAGAVTMYYLKKGKPTKINAWVPAMVMQAGEGVRFHCWLLAKDERPVATTKLYRPGWTNTYTDGGVCMGHGDSGSRTSINNTPEEWEDSFFASAFSGKLNINTSPYVVSETCQVFGTLESALSSYRGPSSD